MRWTRMRGLLVGLLISGNAGAVQAQPQMCVDRRRSELPSSPDHYYSNAGSNGVLDAALSELGPDLCGWIPLSRLDQPGHFWHEIWTGGGSLRAAVAQSMTNLTKLDAELEAGTSPATGCVPLTSESVTLAPGPWPKTTDPWWVNGQNDYLNYWHYRIHGAYVRIVRRAGFTKSEPVHILLKNMEQHFSDFGSYQFGTSPPFQSGLALDMGPEAQGYPMDPAGNYNLVTYEQAVEAGDIVVFLQERFSADVWTALQMTQSAEYFVRHQHPEIPLTGGLIQAGETLGNSYLEGGSWGALVSGYLALMQPEIYAGSASNLVNDFGYFVGEFNPFMGHRLAAISGIPPVQFHADKRTFPFSLMVDVIGSRFDAPEPGIEPWDLAAISTSHRPPSDLGITVLGNVPAEDVGFNPHWADDDGLTRPNFQRGKINFLEHGGVAGFEPGQNEYFLFTGNEWQELLAAAPAPGTANPPVVPETPPALPVIPDPYTHTLRRTPRPALCLAGNFFSEIKINPDSTSPVASIGNGVWPGHMDNLGVADIDADGNTEVFFGNLEGFFQVMEIVETMNPLDPTRLRNEWRSPQPLGWGLFAMEFDVASGKVWIADSLGNIHRVQASGPNAYQVIAPLATSAAYPDDLYEGQLGLMYRANLAPNPGKEILVLNKHLDWILFDQGGNKIARLDRSHRGAGPAQGAAVNLDDDAELEVLVPSLDGSLWYLDVDASGALARKFLLRTQPPRALYRAFPLVASANAGPCRVLLYGRNDNLPAGERNRLMIYTLDGQKLKDKPIEPFLRAGAPRGSDREDRDSRAVNFPFAWIDPPTGNAPATAVLALDGALHTVAIDDMGLVPDIQTTNSYRLLGRDPESGEPVSQITSVRVTEDRLNPGQKRIVAATGSGRVYFFDTQLVPVRDSRVEYEGDPGGAIIDTQVTNPVPWHSNLTLGGERAFDAVELGGRQYLYFCEFNSPFYQDNLGAEQYRVGRIDVTDLRTGVADHDWDPFEANAKNHAPDHAGTNHYFRFADFSSGSTTLQSMQQYFLPGAGTMFMDNTLTPPRLRAFTNRAYDATLRAGANKFVGGYVFESILPNQLQYSMLSGFFPPKDPQYVQTDPLHNYGPNPQDCWYPKVGANRWTGQVASQVQERDAFWSGSSMTNALLPDPLNPLNQVRHIITGTIGGNVYAIQPGNAWPGPPPLPNPYPDQTPSTLSYASRDLGWHVVGMDAGNVDDDLVTEIVVGTGLDDGTFEDWAAGATAMNRGHLIVLDADPATGGFLETDLSGDDLEGTPRSGLSSGVFGARIDDVNNDGRNEIWAGDASGHLYLFRRDGCTQQWQTFARSATMGVYMGLWNNIYPFKDVQGRTWLVVVVLPGYIQAYVVDHTLLPWDPPPCGP